MTGMCWICSHFGIRDIVKRGETKLLVKTHLDVKMLTTDKISQTWFLVGFRVRAVRVKGKLKGINLNEKSPFLLSANSAVYTKKYQWQINIYYIEIGYYFKTFVWRWYFVLKVVNLVKAFTGAAKTCVGWCSVDERKRMRLESGCNLRWGLFLKVLLDEMEVPAWRNCSTNSGSRERKEQCKPIIYIRSEISATQTLLTP